MQINIKNRISTCLSILGIVFVTFAGTDRVRAEPNPQILSFSLSAKQPSSPILLRGKSGRSYQLFVEPELDTGNHVVVLRLRLQKETTKPNGNNLLDGNSLHGYQPFIFAASDFSQGIEKSIYGEVRHLRYKRDGLDFTLKILSVKVVACHPSVSDYEFEALAMTTESANE